MLVVISMWFFLLNIIEYFIVLNIWMFDFLYKSFDYFIICWEGGVYFNVVLCVMCYLCKFYYLCVKIIFVL